MGNQGWRVFDVATDDPAREISIGNGSLGKEHR
jgi:hypothetical protein